MLEETTKRKVKYTGSVGRPRIDVDALQLLAQYKQAANWDDVAIYFGISRSTLFSRLRESGVKKDYHF